MNEPTWTLSSATRMSVQDGVIVQQRTEEFRTESLFDRHLWAERGKELKAIAIREFRVRLDRLGEQLEVSMIFDAEQDVRTTVSDALDPDDRQSLALVRLTLIAPYWPWPKEKS